VTRLWPIAPLLELTKLTAHGLRKQARIHSTVYNNAAENGLTDRQADTWSIRCGLHPAMVWLGWIDAGLSENDRRYLAGGWRQAWLWNEPAELPYTAPQAEEAA
jgi:hypothetical protein